MFNEILEVLETSNRGLNYEYGDKIEKFIEEIPILISYKFLILDENNPYSFKNKCFSEVQSEEFNDLSDFQIYLQKLQTLCTNKIALIDTLDFKLIGNPNKNLKEVIKATLDISNLKYDQIPHFAEIRLYTNKTTNRAPRIFGFFSNANVFNVICYDPFHHIYNANS